MLFSSLIKGFAWLMLRLKEQSLYEKIVLVGILFVFLAYLLSFGFMPKWSYQFYSDSKCIVRVSSIQNGVATVNPCISYDAMISILQSEAWWYQKLTLIRYQIQQRISDSGSDPLNLFRKLILASAGKSSLVEAVRGLGVVHAFTSSGAHLYTIRVYYERILGWASFALNRLGIPVSAGAAYRVMNFTFWLAALSLWALTDFRIAWMRGFSVVFFRSLLFRSGMRWRAIRCFVVLFIGEILWWALRSLWGIKEYSDYGRWHFYSAVFGGIAGLLYLESRQWEKAPMAKKVFVSLGSSLFAGFFEVLTVGRSAFIGMFFLNLWTGFFLIQIAYPIVALGVLLTLFIRSTLSVDSSLLEGGLLWLIALSNRALTWSLEILEHVGASPLSFKQPLLSLGLGLWVIFVLFVFPYIKRSMATHPAL